MMKRLFAGLCVLALVSAISPLALVQAQTAADDKRPFAYDVAKEVTLSGTVLSALDKPAKGMIMGSHLLFATSSGSVDASLASLALQGKHAVSIAAGQQVEVTGVMKTIKEKQVFLARTVKVGGEVYTIRNEHGYPVSQHSRERASRKSAGEGL
jgi:hypothetical protein